MKKVLAGMIVGIYHQEIVEYAKTRAITQKALSKLGVVLRPAR